MKVHKPGTMRSKNFIIPLVVYPFDVMVSLGQTDYELKKALKKFNCEWDDNMICAGAGRFYLNNNNQALIRIWNYPETNEDCGTLSHEIFHIVTHILNRIGMQFKLGTSDEAYSYLVGFLTKEIYNKI